VKGFTGSRCAKLEQRLQIIPVCTLFVWLISHQPTVLFSQNKPATNNQSAVLFSQNKPAPAISHQPNEQTGYIDSSYIPNEFGCGKELVHIFVLTDRP
jgi:hypothetical protein